MVPLDAAKSLAENGDESQRRRWIALGKALSVDRAISDVIDRGDPSRLAAPGGAEGTKEGLGTAHPSQGLDAEDMGEPVEGFAEVGVTEEAVSHSILGSVEAGLKGGEEGDEGSAQTLAGKATVLSGGENLTSPGTELAHARRRPSAVPNRGDRQEPSRREQTGRLTRLRSVTEEYPQEECTPLSLSLSRGSRPVRPALVPTACTWEQLTSQRHSTACPQNTQRQRCVAPASHLH